MFYIKCIDNSVKKYNGWYLGRPGTEKTFTPKLENAQAFPTKEQAENAKNDSEIVVEF